VADDDLAEQLSVSTKGTTGYDPFARGGLPVVVRTIQAPDQARRLAWIDKALAPAATRLPRTNLAALRNALGAVIGLELIVSLRDACGLSPQATEDCLAWTARTIVDAVTAPPNSDHRPPGNRSAT
jgi:hypothetical protein